MEKYVCSICGYIYNLAEDGIERNISLDITFKDLPENWTCPICGANKYQFDIEK